MVPPGRLDDKKTQPGAVCWRPTQQVTRVTGNGHERDAADVERVLSGDHDAYEGIVRRWQGPLVNLAFRFCRNRGQAEEMAQEAFLKVFRNLGRGRREGKFSTWMFAIATKHYRSEMRRTRRPTVSFEQVPEPAGHRTPESQAQKRDEALSVRRAVSSLPPRYRDVMVLFYFNELNVGETARLLKLREGTVKARLHRGRRLLRRRLEGMQAVDLTLEKA